MGEIADMHLDGTLCEVCGDYLGDPPDHTRLCQACSSEKQQSEKSRPLAKKKGSKVIHALETWTKTVCGHEISRKKYKTYKGKSEKVTCRTCRHRISL